MSRIKLFHPDGTIEYRGSTSSWLPADSGPSASLDPQAPFRLTRTSGQVCWHCRVDLAAPFETYPRNLALLLGIAARFGTVPSTSAIYGAPVMVYPPSRPGVASRQPFAALVTGSWFPFHGPGVSAESAATVRKALLAYVDGVKPRRRGEEDSRYEIRPAVDDPDPDGQVEAALALPLEGRSSLVGPFAEFLAGGAFVIGA